MRTTFVLFSLFLCWTVFNKDTDVHRHDKDINLDYEDEVNMTWVDKGEEIWDSKLFTEIASKLGLNSKRNITKEDVKYFLNNIVGRVAKGDFQHIIEDVFDKFIEKFPNLHELTSLKDLNHTDFIGSVKSYFVKEPTFFEKLSDKAGQSWHGVVKFFHSHFAPKEVTEATSKFFNDILVKVGLADKKSLAREDVRKVITYIIGDKVLQGKYKKQFDSAVNDILQTIPDALVPADLIRYLSHSKFLKTLNHYFKEIPEVWENLKYSVGKSWSDMPKFFQQVFNGEFWDSDKFKGLLTTLGMDKLKEFNKENVKKLITSVIGEDVVNGKHSTIFSTIFDTLMKNLPDKIKLEDLKEYLPESNFLNVVMKHFEHEPTLTEKIKDNIGVGWENMKKFFSSIMTNEKDGWDSSIFDETIKKLGWKENKTLKMEDVTKFLDELLGTGVSEGETSIFSEIYKMFLKDFPDNMNLKNLKEYLNHNKFFELAKGMFQKEPTTYDKFINFVSTSWDNMSKFFKNKFSTQKDSLKIKDIIKKLGFETKTDMGKADIENILSNLIGEDLVKKNKDLFNELYKSVFKDLPKKFGLDDIEKYINREDFTSTFTNLISDKFPQLKDKLEEMKDITWSTLPKYMEMLFKDIEDYSGGESRFWRKSTYDRAFKDLGFIKKDEVTKDEFKRFVVRVFFDSNKDVKLSGIVEEVFDSYVEQIPHPIKSDMIESYLTFDRFITASKSVAEKHFGKSSLMKFKSFFEHPQKSISHILHNIFNFTKEEL